jgi:hypothetical protein
MVIMALPAWQSHFSIAAIGNLYVAPSAFPRCRSPICRSFPPDRSALSWRLATKVVDDGEALHAGVILAEELAGKSLSAYAVTRITLPLAARPKWPDVDFGALLQGWRCQSSFHRSSSAKLCKVRLAPNPTKIGVSCLSYA